jgi:hypothetical protein
MGDPTAAFFEELAGRGHDPVLGSTRGSVLVEVTDDRRIESWLVRLDGGAIAVAPGGGDADCTIRATRAAFDELAAGRTGALAATLRGALEVHGDPRLLVRFQRLFPAPTGMPAGAGARSVGRRRS